MMLARSRSLKLETPITRTLPAAWTSSRSQVPRPIRGLCPVRQHVVLFEDTHARFPSGPLGPRFVVERTLGLGVRSSARVTTEPPQNGTAAKNGLGVQKRIPRSGLAVIWREKPTWVLAGEYPGRYLRRPKECPSRQKKLAQPSGRCARVRDTLTAQTYAAEAPQPREKIWQLTMTATQTLSGRAPATGQTSGRSSP